MPQPDLKVVLIGMSDSGKTCLLQRHINHTFATTAITVGPAFSISKVTVGNKSVILGIWDTAAQERYMSLTRIYFRGAKAAIVCYDLTEKESFDKVEFWVNELKKCDNNQCKIYLCGTKLDKVQSNEDPRVRAVDYHTATKYAEEINAKVFETSSKTGHNVGKLFEEIAKDYAAEEHLDDIVDNTKFQLHDQETKVKKKSCRCAHHRRK